jgi:endonuclease III
MDNPFVEGHLFQEDLRGDPWKMLVCCILTNRTRGGKSRKVFLDLIQRYPGPVALSNALVPEVQEIIKPLGFFRRRAITLVAFSRAWVYSKSRIEDLPGIGKYAVDSYKIFVQGNLDVAPTDRELKAHLRRSHLREDL